VKEHAMLQRRERVLIDDFVVDRAWSGRHYLGPFVVILRLCVWRHEPHSYRQYLEVG
jgi:hypothetical protein